VSGELPTPVLARCFLRSLLLQASWNVRGMQNVGFLYAIEPALAHLYPEAERRQVASRRHLEAFNTQAYMAEAILGGAIHHESAIADGRVPESRVIDFKQALAGPLAALGDTFFWASLRPAAAAFGALLVPLIGAWALLAFLLLYNAVHLSARLYLFLSGLRLGDGILEAVGAMRLAERAIRLKDLAAALATLAGLAFVSTHLVRVGYPLPWPPLFLAAGALLLVPVFRRWMQPYPVLIAVAGLGLVLGVVGWVGIR
jgi:mannose PTS system EIID component